jgi:hypothetical protein
MSMGRVRRIGLSEADRLVAGARPDPDMEGLAGLLDAARAATPGEDLAGERAAVAGFLAERQRAVPTAPPRTRRVVRMIAMKAALAIALLAFGGTALAARTGSLPAAAQERAHALLSGVGVPAPAPAPPPAPSKRPTTGGASASAVPSPIPTPAPSATGATATLELCRVWDAARQQPPGKAVPAPTRRALAAAAGGMPKIDAFCAELLGSATASGTASPSATASGSEQATAEPTGPGKPAHTKKPTPSGNGNGKKKTKAPAIDASNGAEP